MTDAQRTASKACPNCESTGWCWAREKCDLAGYQLVAPSDAPGNVAATAGDPQKLGISFVQAMDIAEDGLRRWREKDHNAKWWRKIDGTPIPNDLLVNIATSMTEAYVTIADRHQSVSEPQSPQVPITGAGSNIQELLSRAETYLVINDPDGRGTGLLIMELTLALRSLELLRPAKEAVARGEYTDMPLLGDSRTPRQASEFWEALKQQCAATPDKSKVKALIQVRCEDVVAAWNTLALSRPHQLGGE